MWTVTILSESNSPLFSWKSEVEGYQKQTKQLKLREECVLRLKIEQQSLLKDKKSKWVWSANICAK